MSSIPLKDRVSLCRFTYSDHRKCRTPRSPHHPHFCFYHARLESQSVAATKLADDIQYFFSGEYISANDLSAVLARILPAIIRGDIKPRLAKTIVYLAQTFNQTIHLAQHEYINAYGPQSWRETISTSIHQNFQYEQSSRNPAAPPAPNHQPSEAEPPESDEVEIPGVEVSEAEVSEAQTSETEVSDSSEVEVSEADSQDTEPRNNPNQQLQRNNRSPRKNTEPQAA